MDFPHIYIKKIKKNRERTIDLDKILIFYFCLLLLSDANKRTYHNQQPRNPGAQMQNILQFQVRMLGTMGSYWMLLLYLFLSFKQTNGFLKKKTNGIL